jgi:hypothetical protein
MKNLVDSKLALLAAATVLGSEAMADCARSCQVDPTFVNQHPGVFCEVIDRPSGMNRDFSHGVVVNSSLTGVNLTSAELIGSIFAYSRLTRVHFDRASMFRANFEHTQIERASFREVDLREASFVGAEIERADFRGSDLRGTSFEQARMSDDSRLRGALFDRTTRLPFSRAHALSKGMVWVRLNEPSATLLSTPTCQE